MTFNREQFEQEKSQFIHQIDADKHLKSIGLSFVEESDKKNYGYLWTWLGLPMIQMPEDIMCLQEIIWDRRPDVIIETGIAWGGSVVFYASLLSLYNKNGKVIAIDQVLPQNNIDAITSYDFKDLIHLFSGNSIDATFFNTIQNMIDPTQKVMVILDSNHTHEHVLAELELWSALVTPGQFLVACDTIVEDISEQKHRVRPWGKGNNPKTAVYEFLKNQPNFSKNNTYNKKALATFNPGGYLERLFLTKTD